MAPPLSESLNPFPALFTSPAAPAPNSAAGTAGTVAPVAPAGAAQNTAAGPVAAAAAAIPVAAVLAAQNSAAPAPADGTAVADTALAAELAGTLAAYQSSLAADTPATGTGGTAATAAGTFTSFAAGTAGAATASSAAAGGAAAPATITSRLILAPLIVTEGYGLAAHPKFPHLPAAHCESGVLTALLRAAGLPISEAMTFGLGAALSFCYFPLARINGLPLVSYRMFPNWIVNSLRRSLRLPLRFERFKDPAAGRRRLDELLASGRPAGLRADIFYLPYGPAYGNIHFAGHTIIAFARDGENGDYLISDPPFKTLTRCPAREFHRARFAGAARGARGLLFHLDGPLPVTDTAALVPLIPAAIRKNARMMLHMPLPCVSVLGIRFLAARLRRLPVKKDPGWCRRFAGHIVFMQEGFGTGGAGFRYLYAAFLEEAAALLARPAFRELALELAGIGDEWRAFARLAARLEKDELPPAPAALADALDALARRERLFFKKLLRAV